MTVRLLNIKGVHKPLNSESIKYINKIGVELEGGWEDGQPENIHHDGSVNIDGHTSRNLAQTVNAPTVRSDIHNCHICIPHNYSGPVESQCLSNCLNHCSDDCMVYCGCPSERGHIEEIVVGECISPPSSIEELRNFIEYNHPDKVNDTAGLHVHISMKDKIYYAMLMEKSFYDHFLKTFEQWGKDMGFPKSHSFWSRFEGKNKYCKKEFRPEDQYVLKQKVDDIRRCHLNFCYNFPGSNGKPRGTFECRLFPAFNDRRITMAAVETLVRCVEDFLDNLEKSNQSLMKMELFIDNEEIMEEAQ